MEKLYDFNDKGKLGVAHVPRFWARAIYSFDVRDPWTVDLFIIDGLKLGIDEALNYLFSNRPTLDEFEDWILSKNEGQISQSRIEKINSAILTYFSEEKSSVESTYDALSKEDLEFFDTNGYIVIKSAISKEDAENTIEEISRFVGKDLKEKKNWYNLDTGFWIKMFDNPILEKNRNSSKIINTYKQLLKSDTLFNSHDRVSINPPETESFNYAGSDIHWDASLHQPMPYGLQGLLYLSDVKEKQCGAFACVPGFHKKIDTWIQQFDDESEARKFDVHSLGVEEILAEAGDFIIWDDRLPHGATPNKRGTTPRFVQYINMYRPDKVHNPIWK